MVFRSDLLKHEFLLLSFLFAVGRNCSRHCKPPSLLLGLGLEARLQQGADLLDDHDLPPGGQRLRGCAPFFGGVPFWPVSKKSQRLSRRQQKRGARGRPPTAHVPKQTAPRTSFDQMGGGVRPTAGDSGESPICQYGGLEAGLSLVAWIDCYTCKAVCKPFINVPCVE